MQQFNVGNGGEGLSKPSGGRYEALWLELNRLTKALESVSQDTLRVKSV